MDLCRNKEEDIISSLPDHLIHHILSFVGTKFAVQTCILSKRWNCLWVTLPYLNFDDTNFDRDEYSFANFVDEFLDNRDQYTCISTITVKIFYRIKPKLMHKIANYAISHNLQEITVTSRSLTQEFPLCIFRSHSLKKLTLILMDDWVCESSWNLPSLMTLHLHGCVLLDSHWSFPVLTNLHLIDCKVPLMSWSLPALTTLHLRQVKFIGDKSLSFENFVNLKNLALEGSMMWSGMEVFRITCRNLTSLTISMYSRKSLTCKFLVSAPNLSSLAYGGYSPLCLSAVDGFPCLEKVNLYIHSFHSNKYKGRKEKVNLQVNFQQLISMFQEICGTKSLALSSDTVKLLALDPDYLKNQPSPFNNLECLKLYGLQKSTASTIPCHVMSYLRDGSPSATFVMEFIEGKCFF